ncbi:MAG: hypothetical protein Q7W45_02955 [Bacteroidota bacterium]|nr:hypothetical protein [Bacteroidota bacterium]MDP3145786.1 hypothetical protein [Bacteroidota bacterium]
MSLKDKENEILSSLEILYRGKVEFYTKKLEAILTLKEDETVGHLNAKSVLGDIPKVTAFNVPLQYDRNFSQDQKVYFALRNIESGFVDDVATELAKLQSDTYDFDSAKKIATQKLSKLNGEQKIDFIKIGNKYKYLIKK